MKDIWIGTDFHLRGVNDSKHPYRALGQLEKLVETCKSNIGSDDLFIFLGDLCDPEFAKLDELAVIIQSIPCRKIMCRGNHDTMDDGYYMMIGFDDVADIYRYHNILFSHKPIRVAPDEVNVHAHLHTAKMNAHDANHINAYVTGEKINPDGTAEHWPSIVLLDDVIDAAAVQELGVDEKIQEHLTEKFEKYTSIDHDHYNRIVDITPAIDAIVETVINQPTIDDIVIFCNWMDKTFQYGLSRHGEKIQYKKVNTTSKDYDLYWHLASPDQFVRQGGGICWDYVTYEAFMFKEKFPTVPYKTWYVQFDDKGDCPSHTFLTFTLNGEYYYFENSFRKFAGIYKVGGEADAINFVLTLMSDNPDRSIEPGFLLEKCQYGVWSYNALDRKMIGISCVGFMNYIYDHGTELKTFKYSKRFSTEKVELMNESTDGPMDEILFPDIDSTKYFLADDDAYEKIAKRAKQQREDTTVAIDESLTSTVENDYKPKGRMNLSQFKSKELTEADRKKLSQQYKFLRHFYSTDESHKVIIWMNDDDLVAAIGVSYPDKMQNPGKWAGHNWIDSFEIASDYKGYGLSKQIMKYAISTLHADALGVAKDNKLAQKVYRDMGFRYGGDTNGDNFIMYLTEEAFEGIPLSQMFPMQEATAVKHPDIWYHMVPKGSDISTGIISPEYMYRNNKKMFNHVTDKYRDRLSHEWDIYPDKDPLELTDQEIADGLIKYRGANGLKYIYMFRYAPIPELGPNMAKTLEGKDLYAIDLNKIPDIIEVDYGHDMSNRDNKALNRQYYDRISQKDYFSRYDDDGKLLFASLNHIGVATRSGRIPPYAITKVGDVNEFTMPTISIVPVQESFTLTNTMYDYPLYYMNTKQWNTKQHRVLYVTGCSSSGKSTLAHSLQKTAAENGQKVEVISLDYMAKALIRGRKHLNNVKKYVGDIDPVNTDAPHEMDFEYMNTHPEIRFDGNDAYDKLFDYIQWIDHEARTNPKYKKTLFIVEGYQISECAGYSDEMLEFYRSRPIIVVDRSNNQIRKNRLTRLIAQYREYNQNPMKDIPFILSYLTFDVIDDVKPIREFKKELRPIHESTGKCPPVTATEEKRDNPNDHDSPTGVKLTFFDINKNKVGEASISAIDTPNGFLYDVEVFEKYRGQGYGNSIMQYVLKHYKVTELTVEKGNTVAMSLYKKFGFHRAIDFKENGKDMIDMRKGYVQKVNENFIGTVPDVEWYRDEWKPNGKNFLFICGLSGGGKTTTAAEIAKEVKCEIIHLDDLAQAAFVGKMANPNYTKRMSPTMQSYWNSTTDHIKMYRWGDQRIGLETVKFMDWMIKHHEADGRLYIIEGCEIMYLDPDYLIHQPMIIKGTSAVRTTFWRFKRTYGQHREKGESALKAFEHCMVQIARIYKNGAMIAAENSLMAFKNVLQAARDYEVAIQEESVTESTISEVEEDPVLKKYGLRDVGNTHDVEDEEERIRQRKEQEKRMDDLHKSAKKKREELKKRKQKRLEYLKKARRVKRRKRRIRQLKSLIPGVKNEDINALYENPASANIDTSILPESVIEPVDTIQFFDRIDEAATKSQKLEPVYVILMHTGTPMSKVIKGVIHTEFSHSSIAFDSSLRKMYTFSSRRRNPEKLSPLQMGGFTEEDIRDEFFSGRAVHYAVYMVPCFKDQVKLMKKRLQYFLDNDIKFSYDKIGLVQNLVGMDKEAKNQWFCSEFVADILKTGKPNTSYIDSPFRVRPMDFSKMGFAVKVYEGETFDTYDKKAVDRKVKLLLNQKKMAKLANESVLDIPRENLYEDAILNYQLIMMDETALENFMSYMKSFKVRFDNNGNIIVTRREYDQLDAHFKQSMKMIKTFEEAGNVEGVKDELCKIHYMIQLVNEYYLKPNSRNLREGSKDVRKDMMDLRSVMMNVFKQHLTWVTIQEPNWNFNTYYDGSKYGKDLVLPKKMITTVGRTVITAL